MTETYIWTGSHAYRDHANDRVIEPGEEIPEDSVDRITSAHPHDVAVAEDTDGEEDSTADETTDDADEDVEPPFDPSDHKVAELEDKLEANDYTAAELDALESAEAAGKNRDTALSAIDQTDADNEE